MNQKTIKLIRKVNSLMGVPLSLLKSRNKEAKKEYKRMNWIEKTNFRKQLKEQLQ